MFSFLLSFFFCCISVLFRRRKEFFLSLILLLFSAFSYDEVVVSATTRRRSLVVFFLHVSVLSTSLSSFFSFHNVHVSFSSFPALVFFSLLFFSRLPLHLFLGNLDVCLFTFPSGVMMELHPLSRPRILFFSLSAGSLRWK